MAENELSANAFIPNMLRSYMFLMPQTEECDLHTSL
jgi:hypothetical protein